MDDNQKETQELGLDNIILDVDNTNMFEQLDEGIIKEGNPNPEDNSEKNEPEEEITFSNLLGEEELNEEESSKSEESNQKDNKAENADKDKNVGNSPLSSLANALVEEGVLTSLKEDELKTLKSAEDFKELFEKEINARLDEKTKRVEEALSVGIQPDEIKKNEQVVTYLNNLTEDIISKESEEATQLRTNLIVQDYMNKGFSQERAIKEANKSISAGTDIEDAIEALESNKEYFNKQYSDLINNAKKAEDEAKQKFIKRNTDVKENILNNEKIFADMNINQDLRKKALDNIQKPVYTDENGNKFSTIQKYEKENPVDFLSKVALLYTITDGFTNIEKIAGNVKSKVKSKAFKELEESLSDPNYGLNGSLTFVNNLGGDDNENDKGDFILDIKNN